MYKVSVILIKRETKLRVYRRVNAIILCLLSLIFFSQFAFAQGIDALKSDIYSKLKCCSCKESFVECTCAEAKEMKAYIDALLENKISRMDIFYRVAKKYSTKVIIGESERTLVEERLIKESKGRCSRIIFEPQTLNFGVKSKKEGKVSRAVKLYNKGNSSLIISNLRVSCDCTVVSLKTGKNSSPYFGMSGANSGWQVIIEPGNFGELEVVLDLSHKSMIVGKHTREVFIESNDALNPHADFRVEIEIQE
jgi:hypothetical protein